MKNLKFLLHPGRRMCPRDTEKKYLKYPNPFEKFQHEYKE